MRLSKLDTRTGELGGRESLEEEEEEEEVGRGRDGGPWADEDGGMEAEGGTTQEEEEEEEAAEEEEEEVVVVLVVEEEGHGRGLEQRDHDGLQARGARHRYLRPLRDQDPGTERPRRRAHLQRRHRILRGGQGVRGRPGNTRPGKNGKGREREGRRGERGRERKRGFEKTCSNGSPPMSLRAHRRPHQPARVKRGQHLGHHPLEPGGPQLGHGGVQGV